MRKLGNLLPHLPLPSIVAQSSVVTLRPVRRTAVAARTREPADGRHTQLGLRNPRPVPGRGPPFEKAMRSLARQERDLQAWIANPAVKLGAQADAERVKNLVETKWPKDIRRHREQMEILRGILEARAK